MSYGVYPSNKGHAVSDETRMKMSIAQKKRFQDKTQRFWLGKNRSDEWRQNHSELISRIQKGSNNPNWKGGVTDVNKLLRNSRLSLFGRRLSLKEMTTHARNAMREVVRFMRTISTVSLSTQHFVLPLIMALRYVKNTILSSIKSMEK